MDKNMDKKKKEDETRVASEYYQASYYNGKSQFEKGMAETHEQVSDTYFEGTIDQEKEE